MQTIWKYDLQGATVINHSMPVGARFLALQTQYDRPVAWFAVDSDAPKEVRRFYWVGTGHDMEEVVPVSNMIYLGTIQLSGLRLVFHLFEIINVQEKE